MNPRSVLSSRLPAFIFVSAVAALAGCGGHNSPSPIVQSQVPTVAETGVGPLGGDGEMPATGFDASGKPVFAVASSGGAKWTVATSKNASLYDIPLTGVDGSQALRVFGNYVIGSYTAAAVDTGVAVAAKQADGSVKVSKFPGYSLATADGGTAIVYTDSDGTSYYLLDLSTGLTTPLALPSGAVPYSMRGKFVLCATGDRAKNAKAVTRATGGMLVFDTVAKTSVTLQAATGTDGSVTASAINASGQVAGVTVAGNVAQLRVWSAAGVPGDALDTTTDGVIEPGWISPDGKKVAYGKEVSGTEGACMAVGGKVYPLRTASLPISQLFGLNDAGTSGFAMDDALGTFVSVSVSYR